MGGWGLKITTEDIARFGQLYLQKGKWNGQQVIPETWVAEATMRQVSNGSSLESDWEQGYGYQFWRCRHNLYRGDGAFGQYCIVMPEQDAVLAITSAVNDMQAVMNVAWEHLLPELGPAPLSRIASAGEALEQKLAGLALHPPKGKANSPVAQQVSGKQFQVEANDLKIEKISFDFNDRTSVFHVQGETGPDKPAFLRLGEVNGAHSIVCGSGKWREGMTGLFGHGEQQPVFASGVWISDDTYVITARLVSLPIFFSLICRFSGEQVEIKLVQNVGSDPNKPPVLVGRIM